MNVAYALPTAAPKITPIKKLPILIIPSKHCAREYANNKDSRIKTNNFKHLVNYLLA
jgi:hypothetical protein